MYGGGYSMTPKQFEEQMRFLMDNEYHFVTGTELTGYVEGWLTLPARSVIMTTDSGSTSMKSLPRMTALFDKLKAEYGYAPHFNSYIWTKAMTPKESTNCPEDKCWTAFRKALESGYFSFGTHSESHDAFAEYTLDKAIADLEQSRKEIKDNMGVTVNGISWPFESCPITWMDKLKLNGFIYAYGGWSRSLGVGYTYPKDTQSMCLPRIFPPNPTGLSGRPDGLTLEQILARMKDTYIPLPVKK
jgi:peptidoglycan/xylan/chitin deacetylase (PgdA/CDA1 family)